jgi:hypothetical protein
MDNASKKRIKKPNVKGTLEEKSKGNWGAPLNVTKIVQNFDHHGNGENLHLSSFLAELFPGRSISVLAMLADHGGCISGSQSLQALFPNLECTTENSDIDMYIPRTRQAVEAAVHVLNLCGVTWKNNLTDRLKDIKNCDMTLMLCEKMYETAMMFFSECHQCEESLTACLKAKLSYYKHVDKELTNRFVKEYVLSLQACWFEWHSSELDACSMRENYVWIYNANNKDEPSRICQVPPETTTFMETMIEFLDNLDHNASIITKRSKAKRKEEEEIENRFIDKSHNQKTDAIGAWEKEGINPYLLPKYLNYKMFMLRPWYKLVHVYRLTNKLFGRRERSRASTKNVNRNYESEMRILRGTLPNGRSIQLITVDPYASGLIKTVILRFYSTHVMSFVSGTVAGHFYCSSTQNKKGYLFDFKRDQRHDGAIVGARKWKKRGWVFKRRSRAREPRAAFDDDSKIIDMENIYLAALEKIGGDTSKLPSWWHCYFQSRKKAVQLYSWHEQDGKIHNIHRQPVRNDSSHPDLSEWVGRVLGDHEEAISREEWENHDVLGIRAAIWFGGVTSLLDYGGGDGYL